MMICFMFIHLANLGAGIKKL